jgi:hypothetical protein
MPACELDEQMRVASIHRRRIDRHFHLSTDRHFHRPADHRKQSSVIFRNIHRTD